MLGLGAIRVNAQSVPCTSAATPIASGITGTTYVDSTTPNGSINYYVVVAVNATGQYSTCTPIAGPETIPGSGVHTVSLSWTASTTSGVTYSVFRAVAPNPPTSLTATVN